MMGFEMINLKDILLFFSFLVIGITILGSLVWLIKEEKFIVKLLYFDLLFFACMMSLVIYSVLRDEPLYLDILIVWALIGDIGPISYARFFSKRGKLR